MRTFSVCLCLLAAWRSASAGPVLTHHNDNFRTGATLDETELTVANVRIGDVSAPRNFGWIMTFPVDDYIYAQPLYVPGLDMLEYGVRNVLIVATVNNSIYAFDAGNGQQLRYLNLNQPERDIRPPAQAELPVEPPSCLNYFHESRDTWQARVGIVGTPVISGEWMWFVYRTVYQGWGFSQTLRRMNIRNFRDYEETPISAVVPGSGPESIAGQIIFNSRIHNQRSALLYSDDTVYIAWAGHCDQARWHGWLMAYDAWTLRQRGVFMSTRGDERGAGIWMSGHGPLADENGDVYVTTGNGYGRYNGTTNLQESVLRLRRFSLNVDDYFTPFNVNALDADDLDLGVGGAIGIPGTNLIATGSKTGHLYVVNKNNLGRWSPFGDSIHQPPFIAVGGGGTHHLHGGPTFWDGPAGRLLYLWGENDYIRAYRLQPNNQFNTTPVAIGSIPAPGMPGGMLSLSAHGNRAGTGIVWASRAITADIPVEVRDGELLAYDASDVRNVLWTARGWKYGKFVPPTVANGKVYLATQSNRVEVFGLGMQARFVSWNIPRQLEPGEQHLVSITFQNTGYWPWTAGQSIRLGSQNPQDNTFWGTNRVYLQSDEYVPPGGYKTFTFRITAPRPSAPTAYAFQWRLVQDGGRWFGESTPSYSYTIQPRESGNLEAFARAGNQLFFFWREDIPPPDLWYGPVPFVSGVSGNPVMIQSRLGNRGNFELIVPLASGGLAHYTRANDVPGLPWLGPIVFATDLGQVNGLTFIQSSFSAAGSGPGNFELFARVGDQLYFLWRDDFDPWQWRGPILFRSGVSGDPALIQSRSGITGHFELTIPLASGGLAHYSRDNDAEGLPWVGPVYVGGSLGPVDSITLIQGNFSASGTGPGNLELLARVGDQLFFMWRDDAAPWTWNGPLPFITGVRGTPSLIQSRFGSVGNFELLVPLASGGLAHYSRLNDVPGLPWWGPTVFGSSLGAAEGVTLIQSNFSARGY